MKKTVFITGATGFVGSYLAHHFIKKGHTVIALVRGKGNSDSRMRLQQAITDVEPGLKLGFENLILFEGSVQDLEETAIGKLQQYNIDEIWHCSASFKFKEKDIDEIKSVNITGTKNLLDLAVATDKIKPLRFFYVSTAYSCGIEKKSVNESFYRHKNNFRSYYEWSKHEAEALVAEYSFKYGFNAYIFRPSIIIGGLNTNKLSQSAYYQVIKSIVDVINRLKTAPEQPVSMSIVGDPAMKLNMVTIDFVVNAMLKIASMATLNKNNHLEIFNIVNETPPSLYTVNQSFSHTTGYNGVKFVASNDNMNSFERLLSKSIAFQLPYMTDEVDFQTEKFRTAVPETDLPMVHMDVAFLNIVNANFLRLNNMMLL